MRHQCQSHFGLAGACLRPRTSLRSGPIFQKNTEPARTIHDPQGLELARCCAVRLRMDAWLITALIRLRGMSYSAEQKQAHTGWKGLCSIEFCEK